MFTNQRNDNKFLRGIFILFILIVCFLIFYLELQPNSNDAVFRPLDGYSKPNHLLNLNNFTYSLNSKQCSNKTFAILIVTSYAGDVETRSAVRQAYSQRVLDELGIKRVFLLALIGKNKNFNHIEQAAIENEQERFGDMVQGNFIEDYRNLTYKHVMGLRWVSEHCYSVPYVIKMDHDIVANLFSIVEMLKKIPKRKYVLTGYVMMNMKAIRDPSNKWYVTEEEYPDEYYPDFLSGWLYITNPLTAETLYKSSQYVPYFWIDDTYVTGLLASYIKVPLVKLNKYYTTYSEHIKCCMERPKYDCDFFVGPNGGDNRLIRNFERYSEACHRYKCKKRRTENSVRTDCQYGSNIVTKRLLI